VAPLQGDRSLSPDIMRLEDVVRSGALLQAVRR
jgi:hypothetical protein